MKTTSDVTARLRAALANAKIRMEREGDKQHLPVVAQRGELILSLPASKKYLQEHPRTNTSAKPISSLPRIRGFDGGGGVGGGATGGSGTAGGDGGTGSVGTTAGGDSGGAAPAAPSDAGLPMGHGISNPATMATQAPEMAPKNFIEKAKGWLGKGKGSNMLPGQPLVDVKDSPLLDQEAFDEGGRVPFRGMGKIYDTGGVVDPDQSVDAQNSFQMPVISQSAPAPDPEQDHAQMRMDQVSQKQDQAIVNGDLIDQGKALIAKRQISDHAASLPMIGKTASTMAAIEVPKPNRQYDDAGNLISTNKPGTTDQPYTPTMGEASAAAAGYPAQKGPAVDPNRAKYDDKGNLIAPAAPTLMPRIGDFSNRGGELVQTLPSRPSDKTNQNNQRQMVIDQEEQLKYQAKFGKTEQERFQAQRDLAEIQSQTHWGTPGSSHPGMMGKILSGVSGIAQGLAKGVIPYALPSIPGSRANIAAREQAGEQGVEEAQKKAGTEADTGYKLAETAKTNAEAAKLKTPVPKLLTGDNDTRTDSKGNRYAAYEMPDGSKVWSLEGQVPSTRPTSSLPTINNQTMGTPPPVQAAPAPEQFTYGNKQKDAPATSAMVADYNKRIAALNLAEKDKNAAGIYATAPAGATQTELDKRYQEAAGLRGMNTADAKNVIDERQRKDNADRSDREFNERQNDKLINYRDANGDLVSGTRGEALANGAKEKDMHGETSAALQEKSRQAFTQYSRLQDNAETAMSTLPAWDNENDRKQFMEAAKQYWDHVTFGIPGVAGAGISPEYKQQIINSDAYRKMSPQGREHTQNMFQLYSDAINLAKLETGSSRAVETVIAREERLMPSAEKTQDQNIKALEDLYTRLNKDSKEYPRPSDMDPLRKGLVPYNATHELRAKDGSNKIVGYTGVDGKDHVFGQ